MNDEKTNPEDRKAVKPDPNDTRKIDAAIGGVIEEVEAKKEGRTIARTATANKEEGQAKQRSAAAPIALLFCSSLLVYMWFGASWLHYAPPPGPSAPEVESALRVEMYHLALAIMDFEDDEGKLPASLYDMEDAEDIEGIDYQVLSKGQFRLHGTSAGTTIDYVSTKDPETLMELAANSPQRGK